MRIFFAIALVLALVVTVFAVQNNQPITINFLFWSVEGSLALVLMVTLVFGIVIGALLMVPGSIRNRLQVGGLRRTVRSLEDEKASVDAEGPSPTETETSAPPENK